MITAMMRWSRAGDSRTAQILNQCPVAFHSVRGLVLVRVVRCPKQAAQSPGDRVGARCPLSKRADPQRLDTGGETGRRVWRLRFDDRLPGVRPCPGGGPARPGEDRRLGDSASGPVEEAALLGVRRENYELTPTSAPARTRLSGLAGAQTTSQRPRREARSKRLARESVPGRNAPHW
jgi:hypothetical protein